MQGKILITGATGMVGKELIAYLQQQQNSIEILAIARKEAALNEQIHCASIDLLDAVALENYIRKVQPDYIINLAAQSSVGVSWAQPQQTINNNVQSFTNLLEAIRLHAPKAICLHVGSAEVYGLKQTNEICMESDTLNPINPYAVSRVLQEEIADFYINAYGLNIIRTRSFNHLGVQQVDKFFIPSILNQIRDAVYANKTVLQLKVGNINVVRDFLDVRDVVKAYILLLQKGVSGKIYNVCSGNGIALTDIISKLALISGMQIQTIINPNLLRSIDNEYLVGDYTALKDATLWSPSYSIDQILEHLYLHKINSNQQLN